MTLTDYLLSPDRDNAQLGLTMAANLLTEEEIFNAVFEAFRIAYAEKERLQAEYEGYRDKFMHIKNIMEKLQSPAYNHPFARNYDIRILDKFIFQHTNTNVIRDLIRNNQYPHLIVKPSDEYKNQLRLLIYCVLSPPTANKYEPRTVHKIGYAFQKFGIVEHECVSSYDGLRNDTNFFKVMHKCFCL